jgi:lipopolysaccharide export system protein LptC
MAQFVNDPRSGQLVQATAAGGAIAPRTRLERWQQRERPRVDATLGYSRFVRIMKVALPIVAFSLIVLVVLYSATGREGGNVAIQFETLSSVDKDRQLVKPKLTGTDGRGQPFTVTANGATQAPGKTRKLSIDDVTADITLQDRSWVSVGAVHGLLDVEGKTLDLTQTINIYSDRGYECHTESARYDFGKGLLKGEKPINCQGPMGLISGQKFEGLRDPGIMRFTGGVSTTYFPTPREGIAKDAAQTNPEGIAEPVPDESAGGSVVAVEATPLPPPPGGPAPIQPRPKPPTP